MRQRIPKNSGAFLKAAVCILSLLLMLAPQVSYAYDFYNPYGNYEGAPYYDVGNPNNTINTTANRVCWINESLTAQETLLRYGLSKRVVMCVKHAILAAVYEVLVPFSDFFAQTIAVMCTLAVIIWGMQVVAGRRAAPTREAFVLGVKIGAVIMFTSSLYGGFAANIFDPDGDKGGLFGMILDAMEDMLRLAVSYVTFASSFVAHCPAFENPPDGDSPRYVLTIWDTVDCALDQLVGGIFSPLTLTAGIVGFLIAALVSSVVGFFIALLGFMLISMFLMSVARAIYIFITAYVAFALMVVVSPMFIPLILFRGTKAYFEKWLKLTIGFILQPVFIFVYLAMMVAAYDSIVYSGQRSLYRSVIGDHIDGNYYKDPDTGIGKIGDWLLMVGVYFPIKHGEASANLNHAGIPQVCDETSCELEQRLTKLDSGVLGIVGEQVVTKAQKWQQDIYDVLGNQNIFRTSFPMNGINWYWAAAVALAYNGDPDEFNPAQVYSWVAPSTVAYSAYTFCRWLPPPFGSIPPCPDPLNFIDNYFIPYIIGIFLAAIMAVITAYIFMHMLEYLPFIGSGISGESLSMPTFGVGSMAPPGSGAFTGMRNKLANAFMRPS